MNHSNFRYTPSYCEENVWHLCRDAEFSGLERKVVFISNELRVCPIWGQRAAPSVLEPVLWDYHVLLVCRQESWMVWDLDTLIGFPVTLGRYLQEAFRATGLDLRQFAPLFRVVDAAEYLETFSSDRSHMRNPSDKWLAPPPSWPAITQKGASNLAQFIDMNSDGVGTVMTLPELQRYFRS